IQYWSPNWNGFVFRFAWTAGNRDEIKGLNGHEVDPVIRSSSLAYTNGPFWGAVTWQDHEDWTAVSVGNADGAVMETSDAESIRIAGRYIMDLGDGMSVQISAMWEDMEYEFNDVTSVDAAMAAFGYSDFGSSYSLLDNAGNAIGATAEGPGTSAVDPTDDEVKAQKTIDLMRTLFPACWGEVSAASFTASGTGTAVAGDNANGCPASFDASAEMPDYLSPYLDNPATEVDESGGDNAGNGGTSVADASDSTNTAAVELQAAVMALQEAAMADAPTPVDTDNDGTNENQDAIDAHANAVYQYNTLLEAAKQAARDAGGGTPARAGTPAATAAENRAAMTAGQNVKIERDAWMVSGKIKFGGPIDFRFSYMDADDLEVSCASCSGDWDETAADAWNVGLFYTMPGGTELRLTYSEVDNDDNGTYGQGISGTGLGTPGAEIEMFAVGIVHWFD
ncbi:MAG: hypothetical protein OXH88_06495, partial [Gammaproteobacteria bacterium]|nr:hypothetical protein [Gammaproteobacteria bacterium]